MQENEKTREQLVQELRAANEKYASLFEGAGDSIFIVDAETSHILEVNTNAVRRLGYSREELLQMTLNDIEVICSSDSADNLQWASSFSGTQVYECEYRRKDGSLQPVEVSSRLAQHNQQEVFQNFVRDITIRKQAEEALRQSEEQYRGLYKEAKGTEARYISLLNSTLDAIVIYDIEGRTEYTNDAFTQLFGWSAEEIRDQIPFVPDSEKEVTFEKVMKVVRDGIAVSDLETRRFTKDGDILDVSISASRFNDHLGHPAGMVVILRNITDQVKAKQELAASLNTAMRLQDEAESANRAKSVFLTNMSHEFRTPLNAILGFAQVMKRNRTLPSDMHENLGVIMRSGENLLALINQLLDLSKTESGSTTLNETDFDRHRLLLDVAPQQADYNHEMLPLDEIEAALDIIPAELLARLRDSLELGDMEVIVKTIIEIREHHFTLAKALDQLAQRFQFNELLLLLKGEKKS
jgi:PAS domain S-box-containing protein